MRRSCTVITPTTGAVTLVRCLDSVQRQSYGPLRHLVYVDGPAGEESAREAVRATAGPVPVDVMVAPDNTGGNRFFGHRLYASAAFVVNSDVVLLLDEDNWIDDEHVEQCMRAMRDHGTPWAYALRSLRDGSGALIALDDCDSLGYWPRYGHDLVGTGWFSADEDSFNAAHPFLVDTNCFAVATRLFVEHSHVWYGGYGTDAIFTSRLMEVAPGSSTGRYTVNYLLHTGTRGDLTAYFAEGNRLMLERYGSPPPWRGFSGVPHGAIARPAEVSYRP